MRKKTALARVETYKQRYYLGRRGGPPLISESWTKDGSGAILQYSLAYVDFMIHSSDNGRVLGYDNGHGFHERHFFGVAAPVEFTTYERQAKQFFEEVARIRSKHG